MINLSTYNTDRILYCKKNVIYKILSASKTNYDNDSCEKYIITSQPDKYEDYGDDVAIIEPETIEVKIVKTPEVLWGDEADVENAKHIREGWEPKTIDSVKEVVYYKTADEYNEAHLDDVDFTELDDEEFASLPEDVKVKKVIKYSQEDVEEHNTKKYEEEYTEKTKTTVKTPEVSSTKTYYLTSVIKPGDTISEVSDVKKVVPNEEHYNNADTFTDVVYDDLYNYCATELLNGKTAATIKNNLPIYATNADVADNSKLITFNDDFTQITSDNVLNAVKVEAAKRIKEYGDKLLQYTSLEVNTIDFTNKSVEESTTV